MPFGAFVGALVRVVKRAEQLFYLGNCYSFIKIKLRWRKFAKNCDFLILTLKISRKPEYSFYGQYFENFLKIFRNRNSQFRNYHNFRNSFYNPALVTGAFVPFFGRGGAFFVGGDFFGRPGRSV